MQESSSSGESRRIVAKSRHDEMVLFAQTVSSDEEASAFRSEHSDLDVVVAFEDDDTHTS